MRAKAAVAKVCEMVAFLAISVALVLGVAAIRYHFGDPIDGPHYRPFFEHTTLSAFFLSGGLVALGVSGIFALVAFLLTHLRSN